MSKIIITANESDQRLDRFLRKYLKTTSLTEIYKMIRKKDILVNGKKAAESYRLKTDDEVEIKILKQQESFSSIVPAGRDFKITFEDKNLLVADKPPELILHPDKTHKEDTLIDQVLYYLYEEGSFDPEIETTFKPAAVNRLDLNTGGLVIFAKNYPALQELSKMMRNRDIKKYYQCLVKGFFAGEKTYKAYLDKDTEKNIVNVSEDKKEDSKEIHTKAKALKTNGEYTLLEIELITGRSHQIRAHLSSMNYPIIGDKKYGQKEANDYFRKKYGLMHQFLYAYRIYFEDAPENLVYLKGKSIETKLPSIYSPIIKELFNG
ncbi:ribosomal large subunit pseudouridine synthase C [Oxobacter pfennigii]|uniref:Pseudouridine synthase n=1 Tax=Oxobacter pfennigii TaxID=36849 RepID=A0A0P8WNV4_9CLOT|nr:RluA family pseudouridine synthase [Oxobacter pfennigii]KPU44241.1 ribosomal large subunit pseudouridine synthase C [Oxobacter pfennigii]